MSMPTYQIVGLWLLALAAAMLGNRYLPKLFGKRRF